MWRKCLLGGFQAKSSKGSELWAPKQGGFKSHSRCYNLTQHRVSFSRASLLSTSKFGHFVCDFLLTGVPFVSAFLHTVVSGASRFPLAGNTSHEGNFVRQRNLNFGAEWVRESTTYMRLRTACAVADTAWWRSACLACSQALGLVPPTPPLRRLFICIIDSWAPSKQRAQGESSCAFPCAEPSPVSNCTGHALSVPLQSWSLKIFEKVSFPTLALEEHHQESQIWVTQWYLLASLFPEVGRAH